MPRCPNCNYELVLIPRRRKYKCPKCGKSFSQKEIELKEFQKFNKEERKKARKQKHREVMLNYQAKKIIPKIIEEIKNPKPKKSQAEQKREYRKNLSGQQKKLQNEKRNARRHKNIDGTRLNSRIEYWRNKQKALALKILENKLYTPYEVKIQFDLPTIALSYLLTQIKSFKNPNFLLILDGHSRLETPDPVPNSEVKLPTFASVLSMMGTCKAVLLF